MSGDFKTLAWSPAAEERVRKLRDTVYGVPSTDNNWEHCKENWIQLSEIKWLEEKAQIPLKNYLKNK